MNGQVLLDLLTQILGDEAPNQAYMLTLINISKMKIEAKRPWKVLSTVDSSQTVNGSNTYLIPFTLPSNFYRYLGESSLMQGSIILFDGNDNIQVLTEVPIENILYYRNQFGYFAVDYGTNQFYICGIVPGNFTIYQYYIQTTLPITILTSWQKFPQQIYPTILAFDAAARWRLGTDYDEVASANADDNVKMVTSILDAMESWDTELAISAINSIDYVNNRPNYINKRSNNSFLL